MPKLYLLPCACGKNITIEVSQAGETLSCPHCGASVDIPTMRAIWKLEPADVSFSEAGKPSWSPRQGLFFAVGLVMTIVGLVAVGLLLIKRNQVQKLARKPEMRDVTEFNRLVDRGTADQLLEYWLQEIEYGGLGFRTPPSYLEHRQELWLWTSLLIVAVVVTVGGTAATGYAFYLRPRT